MKLVAKRIFRFWIAVCIPISIAAFIYETQANKAYQEVKAKYDEAAKEYLEAPFNTWASDIAFDVMGIHQENMQELQKSSMNAEAIGYTFALLPIPLFALYGLYRLGRWIMVTT